MRLLATRRVTVIAAAVIVVGGLSVPIAAPVAAQTVAQSAIVSDNPAAFTPNVLDGRVNSFAQVGDLIIAGGSFSKVQAAGGGSTLTRNNLVAFNATTGAISTTFAPTVAGEVYDVEAAGDGSSVYVVGSFTQVNGSASSRLARINVNTGQKVGGFSSPSFNAVVKNVDLVGSQLLVGGSFKTVGGQSRTSLASLNPATGALTPFLNLAFSGQQNGGALQVLKMAVSPDGTRLVTIGNFTQINGSPRQQIAMTDLTGATATLTSWATDFYTNTCNKVFDTYMRDLDFSPDSSYFVVSTTGAYGGADSPCDVITRWETSASGGGQQATWRDYTGGDTTYAVAVTGAAVYVGGHMRWLNNAYAGDQAGPGAVPREGIAALDPVSGLPLSWNPGRARGVGVFDLFATGTGLWVGSDTDRLGGETHRKIGFFPLAGGTTPPTQNLATLPGDVYLLGGTAASSDPGVLYRVNAGGPALQSADDGPDWTSDAAASGYKSGASNTSPYGPVPTLDASVPQVNGDRAPRALFSSEAWGPSTGPDEMGWHFPATPDQQLTVRLYMANRYSGTSQPGQRVYDVSIDGVVVAPAFDPAAVFGDQVGGMLSFNVTSDGTLDIGFRHITENPLIEGIEIAVAGSQPGTGTGATGAAVRRSFNGSTAGADASVPGASWALTRGAFLVDNTLYTGHADGTLTRQSFNSTTSSFGSTTVVDMYGGSFGSDISNVTGMAYSAGRLYYTLFGDNTMHWRWFSPQSNVVGAVPFDVSGNGGLTLSNVQGMFLSNSTLYVADRASGNLLKSSLSGTALSGSTVTANSAVDWRARGMFLAGSGATPPVNHAPQAVAATTGCTDLTCTFSSAGSNDPDAGDSLTYAWNFDDGQSSTAANPQHTFGTAGPTLVTLTVTDSHGASASATTTAQPTEPAGNQTPIANIHTPVSCSALTCAFDGSGSSDPDGNIASYAWSFDGAGTGPGNVAKPNFTYTSPGTYSVELTVTDDEGATGTASASVTVSVPTGSDIAFRGVATQNGNVKSVGVPTPSETQPGDALLLFVTNNKGLTPNSAPTGWTQVGDRTDGADLRTTLYQRVAPATGNLGTIAFSAQTKTNVTVLAYDGALAAPSASASAAKSGSGTTFAAPDSSVPTAGSWVVSFYAMKASVVPAWTSPGGTTVRASSSVTGGGLISGFAVDQGPVAIGTYAGKTATATVSAGKATLWTVVLNPS